MSKLDELLPLPEGSVRNGHPNRPAHSWARMNIPSRGDSSSSQTATCGEAESMRLRVNPPGKIASTEREGMHVPCRIER